MLKKIKELIKCSDSELEKAVLEDVLDEEVENGKGGAKVYLSDLLSHGCVSGMVSNLIYYTDTKAFYIKHMDEIHGLYEEAKDETGGDIEIGTPPYNWFAWFGYEETARKVAEKLGFEL